METKFSFNGEELMFHDEEFGNAFLKKLQEVQTICEDLSKQLTSMLDNKVDVKLTLTLSSKEEF